MKRTMTVLAASLALAAPLALSATAAQAGSGSPPKPRTIATGLFTPLSLAVDDSGNAYVSQNFAGELVKIRWDGSRSTIATAPGQEVGAVSTSGRTVYYATTGQDPAHPSAALMSVRRGSQPRQVADLYAHESTKNPDGGTTYGFRGLPQSCAAQFPADRPATYTGGVDSHPYATLATRHHVYVADAGGNTILKVGKDGRVRTVASLPAATPVVVTAAIATAEGFPSCAVGQRYYFEFVPTDVEQGKDGRLYVTSLPGGPEDASLGARGALYSVNPENGRTRKVAGGFVGAVNLAVGPRGQVAVAELFGGTAGAGQVTVVWPGSSRRQVLTLASPGALEWTGGRRHSTLYATTNAFVPDATGAPQPIGALVTMRMGERHH